MENPLNGMELADRLNAGCQCVSLDRQRLEDELERVSPGFHDEVMLGRPHLFSDSMVFVSGDHVRQIGELVAAIGRVVALPAYQEHVLAWAPANARRRPAARGVFFGYDFHVGRDGPRLIEINTNAGGALLNALLARAHKACCDDVKAFLPGDLQTDSPEHLFVDMFMQEWQLGRAASADFGAATPALPRAVAIVDVAPPSQYLYPEFVLFQRLFASAGLPVVICDPSALVFRDGQLWHGSMPIDLVYNRLTDFSLDDPANAALSAAWQAGRTLITPHPHAHALFADKRNLVVLSDDALLASWGLDGPTRAVLAAGIPATERVRAEMADDLWARRRQLFFKPAAGYGSKAAYRGDKLTRRVFDEILAGDYIAQALVPPSSRSLQREGAALELKLDLRAYVYHQHVQLIAARLWQGQTTNFRTPGGGFAPVLEVNASPAP